MIDLSKLRTLQNLENAQDVVYEDVFKESDKVWCVKGLVVTRRNLVVTWKVGPQMGISLKSNWLTISPKMVIVCHCKWILFQFVPKKKRKSGTLRSHAIRYTKYDI